MAQLLGPPDVAIPEVERPSGRLALAGLVGAGWSAGFGLVVTVTLSLVGWITAPHQGAVGGVSDALRAAATLWLAAHHASFAFPGGNVGLLPLGLMVLPALPLFRAGEWVVWAGRVTRLRHLAPAGTVLAVPYALLGGALAMLAGGGWLRPSLPHSLLGCFLLACVAGGAGAVRAVGGRRVLAVLPDRARAVAAGATGAVAVLVLAGSLLAGIALGTHVQRAATLAEALAPGAVGGFLLLVLQAAYVPNAVLWAVSYAAGPGFAVGAGTAVAPSGIALADLPALPLLAALPQPGPAPVASYAVLVAPYAAGAVAGWLTARRAPVFSGEAAAFWGLAAGVCSGLLLGAFAALSAGPLGDGRLQGVGPVGWQVAAMAALEIGLSAAVAAWVTDRVTTRSPLTTSVED